MSSSLRVRNFSSALSTSAPTPSRRSLPRKLRCVFADGEIKLQKVLLVWEAHMPNRMTHEAALSKIARRVMTRMRAGEPDDSILAETTGRQRTGAVVPARRRDDHALPTGFIRKTAGPNPVF